MLDDIVTLDPINRDELIRVATKDLRDTKDLALTEAFIEKDFWVTFMLKVIFECSPSKDYFNFKGGTSLSKGFNIIDRFSEDIDLILDWQKLGYTDKEVYTDRSRTQQAKFANELTNAANDWIKKKYLPELKTIVGKITNDVTFSLDDEGETIIVEYPHVHNDNSILSNIRLEIGPLAAWSPSKNICLHSYLGESNIVISNYNNEEDIIVPTITPERTFWEKATILHAVANRGKVTSRYSRHYYDLYQLAHNEQIKASAFENVQLLEKVAEFKDKFYHTKAASYNTANTKELKLVPADISVIEELKDDYKQMKNMMFKTPPTLDDILSFLQDLEIEIHNL